MSTSTVVTSPVSSSARTRVQVDFSRGAYERLQEIKQISGDRKDVDVIRDALRLYGWYLEKKVEGYQILVAKGDEVKQVELLL